MARRKHEDPLLHLRCTRCGSTSIEKLSSRVLRCRRCGTEGSTAGTTITRAADRSHAGPEWDYAGFGGYRKAAIRYDD